jgi:penicillin-binding protein 2
LARRFKDGSAVPSRFKERNTVHIDRRNFELVVEGMAECVNRGTARIAQIPDIQVCGKTGTSQNPHGEDHSVFFAFAPKDKPTIAVAVFVENAGWGASYAAPIASLIIEKKLNKRIATARLPVEERMVKANLVDKYLRIAEETERRKNQPVAPVKPDTLPDEKEIPSDVPEGPIGALKQD